MLPSEAVALHRTRIREIALSHRVCNVRVFGSVMHQDDCPDSDLDLLVESTSQTTLLDIGEIWLILIYAKSARDNVTADILKQLKQEIENAHD